MIWVLLVLVLFILGMVAYVVGYVMHDSDLFGFLGVGVGGISGFVLLCLLAIVIVNNTPIACDRLRIKYEQNVTQLTTTRSAIETITDDYARSIAIQQYNIEVNKFKQDILVEQLKLSSPWTNWLAPHVYNEFDANVVSYIQ